MRPEEAIDMHTPPESSGGVFCTERDKIRMRILVIEDDRAMAGYISHGLQEERFVVDVARTGEEGMYLAHMNSYDAIVLDVMLPDSNGFCLCKELRAERNAASVLMLSARDSIEDKVLGLNSGADDYVVKPFDFDELIARLGAVVRRRKEDRNPTLCVGDLILEQLSHEVYRGSKRIVLTSTEYNLLEYLMLHTGEVVSRTDISEHVWHEDYDSYSNVVDVFMSRLRKKIDKCNPPLIHSIHGVGYTLSASS